MKTEKELQDQEHFEATPLSDEDKRVYTLLMAELDKAPEINVPTTFSADILKRVMAKRKKEARWEAVLFGSVIAGVILLVILMMSFVISTANESQSVFQDSPLLPALVLVSMLVIFQVLDKKYFSHRKLKKHLRDHQ